jgi:hypothetical protein
MNGTGTGSNAWLEHRLALAWKNLYGAANEAERAGYTDLASELHDMCSFVRREQEILLKKGRTLRTRGNSRAYLYPSLLDDGRSSS